MLGYLRYLSLIYYFVEYLLVLVWQQALDRHIREYLPSIWKVLYRSCTHCVSVSGCGNNDHNTTSTNDPSIALQLLAENGYDVQYYQKDIWILILFSVVLFTISYLFLRKKSQGRVAY